MIEFYDVKYRRKVFVPKENCHLETFDTSRGVRTRIVAIIFDDPDNPTKERRLSKICSKDFKL